MHNGVYKSSLIFQKLYEKHLNYQHYHCISYLNCPLISAEVDTNSFEIQGLRGKGINRRSLVGSYEMSLIFRAGVRN